MQRRPASPPMATGRTTPVLLAMLALVMRLVASSLPLAADPAEVARADAAAFTALLGGSICHLGDAAPADPSPTRPPRPRA